MTESEVSKKPSFNKPKWLKDDDDDDIMRMSKSKSFMKQPKAQTSQQKTAAPKQDEDEEVPRLSLDNSTLSTNRDGKNTKKFNNHDKS